MRELQEGEGGLLHDRRFNRRRDDRRLLDLFLLDRLDLLLFLFLFLGLGLVLGFLALVLFLAGDIEGNRIVALLRHADHPALVNRQKQDERDHARGQQGRDDTLAGRTGLVAGDSPIELGAHGRPQ
ncbi:hypothetical protein PP1Y_AT21019 [Novosphingobium sp. PP1Y]|nr:hypothetical protein PP1Y_AT21019 [Novosphingobium sp. PP1Y]